MNLFGRHQPERTAPRLLGNDFSRLGRAQNNVVLNLVFVSLSLYGVGFWNVPNEHVQVFGEPPSPNGVPVRLTAAVAATGRHLMRGHGLLFAAGRANI